MSGMPTSSVYTLSATATDALQFYEDRAHQYIAASRTRQPSPDAQWLVREFGPGLSVVDAGCGDGVDTEYLVAHGMKVYAYDASSTMVALARARLTPLGQEVHSHRHDELRVPKKADAILALASLLFLPRDDLRVALRCLADNLAPGGLLIASFKAGRDIRDAGDGRTFHDFEEDSLPVLARMAGLEPEDARRVKDFSGRPNDWVSFVLRKPCA